MATNRASDELVQLFDDLVRCETRLYNAVGDTLRREHGIVTTQYELLRHLRDHPGSRIADVATNFAAGVGAISKGVARLEGRGWVARHPNPADGRSSLVTLTASGAELVDAAEDTFRLRLAELAPPALAHDRLREVGEAMRALRTSLEENRLGVPIG